MQDYSIRDRVTMSYGSEAWKITMAKFKGRAFSKVQTVKAHARAVVGTPPSERVLPDPKKKRLTAPRHKQTLADLLPPEPRQGDLR